MRRPDRDTLKTAIHNHAGIVKRVAEEYGVTRATIYDWLDKADLRGELELAREDVDDDCYISLRQMIRDKDRWAIGTWLRLRGKIAPPEPDKPDWDGNKLIRTIAEEYAAMDAETAAAAEPPADARKADRNGSRADDDDGGSKPLQSA